MTIVHFAYAFNLHTFASDIQAIEAWRPTELRGYQQLQEYALTVYDHYPHVRALCSMHGGWDRPTLIQEFAATSIPETNDIQMWLMLVLYRYLTELPYSFHSRYHTLDHVLQALTWDAPARHDLIYGLPFAHFPDQKPSSTDSTYWHHFGPAATAGSAGWLDSIAITRFLNRLRTDYAQLQVLVKAASNDQQVQIGAAVYTTALNMLQEVLMQTGHLCYIISG